MVYIGLFIAGLIGTYIFGFVFGDKDLLTLKGFIERVFIMWGVVSLVWLLKEIIKTAVKEAIEESKD